MAHVAAVDLLLAPQAAQDFEILVHQLAALVKGYAHCIELALVPAGRHAQEQPPVGDLVHAGELLCQRHRIAQRQDKHAGAEFYLFCTCGDRRQRRQRVEDRKARLDPEQDVIPDPDRIEAEFLHPHAVVDELLGVRHLRIGGEIARGDAERAAQCSLHACVSKSAQAVNRRSGSSRRSVESSCSLGGSVTARSSSKISSKPVLSCTSCRVTPGLSAATFMRRSSSSNENTASSVTTRNMPPVGSPLFARESPPLMKPGLVMKSTCSTKRRFSCFIATIMLARLEMSLPPPVPGSRVFGCAGSPMNDELRLPNWSICAPPMKPTST